MKLTIHTTTFTENEVFGTACNDCGHCDFTPVAPTRCTECDSDNLDPADGCEIPYDDDHTVTEVLTGTRAELDSEARDLGLTETDGDTYRDPDGSTISNYYTGERQEVTAHLTDA